MRQSHRAGEKMFIDYAGPTVALIEHGAEVGRANIFVATMAASGYSFALATPRQTAADWLHGTACALTFFGGAPQLIIPDNPRALVTQANRYEPLLTDSVLVRVNYPGRPATTILAGGGGGCLGGQRGFSVLS